MQESKVYQAIIRTLSYSDVFDYPLRKKELWKFLNTQVPINRERFNKSLGGALGKKLIEQDKGYYFLNGKKKIVGIRLEREKISRQKLAIARKTAKILSIIPTIKLIGISGSLSMKNARLQDDIDLFIITAKGSLWITRFFVNVFLLVFKSKRSVKDSQGMNLVCPNLFISEDALLLSASRRNLFSAREISQLYVLLDKDNTYKRFLNANFWVGRYLPNIQPRLNPGQVSKNKPDDENNKSSLLSVLDKVFYAFQFLYMSNRITGEEVRHRVAYFHPQNRGMMIMKIYKLRYEEYSKNILQDIDKKSPILYI